MPLPLVRLGGADPETRRHGARVAAYALHLARLMGLPGPDLEELHRGALLHDVGKAGIPPAILRKPGPLNRDEWAQIRTHPVAGYRLLRRMRRRVRLGRLPRRPESLAAVLYHHERWDGTGYPRGLRGEQIPLWARIIAVADTFDALTSDRPYRRAVSIEAARAEIARCRGTQLDPQVVDAFLAVPGAEWAELGRSADAGRAGDAAD